MRVLVFYDLPVLTAKQKKAYRIFRTFLISNGFIMLQESVYCRLASSPNAAKAVQDNVKKNRPKEGLVQMLTITEKQFNEIEFITGLPTNNVIDSNDRVIIL